MRLLLIVLAVFFLAFCGGQAEADENKLIGHRGSVISLCIINAILADRVDEILDNYEGDEVHFFVYSRNGSKVIYIIPTSDFFKQILNLAELGSYEEEYEQWVEKLILDEMRLRVILKQAKAGLDKSH